MINAIIENKDGESLIWEFPNNIYKLYRELQNFGVLKTPSEVRLTEKEDSTIKVKLYADSDIGNHLIQLFSEENSLEDVEDVTSAVEKANDIIKEDLEQQIIYDQYSNPEELYEDIHQMLYDAGTETKTFYFPLVGNIYESECENIYEASNSLLTRHEDDIRETLENYIQRDIRNMAEYFVGIGDKKLLLADWDLAYIDGNLYGKVDARLTEPLTEEETEYFKDWISGQNSDGLGEGFEQQDIEIDDGILNVSFWHSGDDYFIYDQEEMDRYIENQQDVQFGEM